MDTSGNIFGCPETLERLWERSSSRIMAEGGAAGEWGLGFFRGGTFLKVFPETVMGGKVSPFGKSAEEKEGSVPGNRAF